MNKKLLLIAHPHTPPRAIGTVAVELAGNGNGDLLLAYHVGGAEQLLLPERSAVLGRAEGLWKRTCFELFVRSRGASEYFEFNFSPSTEWAAYGFSGYREGMRNLPLSVEPRVMEPEANGMFRVELDSSALPDMPLRIGLSAVIEEKDGTKSYWALAHPPGKPDFHHDDCFVLGLPK